MTGILMVAAFIVSFIIMRRSVTASRNTENREILLNQSEKIWVWVLCFLSPILAGGVFYYGWRTPLPEKAEQANKISWMAFFLRLVVEIPLLVAVFMAKKHS